MTPSPNIAQGLEAVRRRPGMYIGGTDQTALNNCVLEVLANSIEEHLAGRGSVITVTVHDDGSLSVVDEGGGISVAPHPKYQVPFIELALTTLHVPDDYLQRPYRVLGHCGVGTKCVNAVSEWMQVRTIWEGREYEMQFARGLIQQPLRQSSEQRLARGTTVTFKPDPEIFKALTFDRNFLSNRLDQLAVLHPGLALVLEDERPNPARKALRSLYHYLNGIADFLSITSARTTWRQPEPLVLKSESVGMRIALGFQFAETASTSILSFVNSSPTILDGTHVTGFLSGLADGLNSLPECDSPVKPSECCNGLHAFVAVWLTDPKFGGATRDCLINPEVEIAVRELAASGFREWASKSGNQAKWLYESLDEARRGEGEEGDSCS